MKTYLARFKDCGRRVEYTFENKEEARHYAALTGGELLASVPRGEMTDEDIANHRMANVTRNITDLAKEIGISRAEYIAAFRRAQGYTDARSDEEDDESEESPAITEKTCRRPQSAAQETETGNVAQPVKIVSANEMRVRMNNKREAILNLCISSAVAVVESAAEAGYFKCEFAPYGSVGELAYGHDDWVYEEAKKRFVEAGYTFEPAPEGVDYATELICWGE